MLHICTFFLLSGDESLSKTLRVATACELHLYAEFYANYPELTESSKHHEIMTQDQNTLFSFTLSDEADRLFNDTRCKKTAVKKEASRTLEEGCWSGLQQIFAVSSVPRKRIFAVYPVCNFGIRPLMHGLTNPREESLILI